METNHYLFITPDSRSEHLNNMEQISQQTWNQIIPHPPLSPHTHTPKKKRKENEESKQEKKGDLNANKYGNKLHLLKLHGTSFMQKTETNSLNILISFIPTIIWRKSLYHTGYGQM